MSDNGNLSHILRAAQSPQVVVQHVATPLSDIQLVSLIAAQVGGSLSPVEAVKRAVEIIVEASVESTVLREKMDARKKQFEAEQGLNPAWSK